MRNRLIFAIWLQLAIISIMLGRALTILESVVQP